DGRRQAGRRRRAARRTDARHAGRNADDGRREAERADGGVVADGIRDSGFGRNAVVNQEQERTLLRRRILGWGLACELVDGSVDIGRDLVLAVSAAGRDVALVEGMDNLTQVLKTA